MTGVSVDIWVDANDELWSLNHQFGVKKTVMIGRSGLPESHTIRLGISQVVSG